MLGSKGGQYDEPSVTVLNLATGREQRFTCSPREAVIAAHAQSLRDWNTWDYREKYDHLVREGGVTFSCGDFAAMKE